MVCYSVDDCIAVVVVAVVAGDDDVVVVGLIVAEAKGAALAETETVGQVLHHCC